MTQEINLITSMCWISSWHNYAKLVFEKLVDHSKLDAKEIERIKEEYNILIENHGAVVKSVTRIVRTELESPSILQNADFSLRITKELIAQGERKTFEELAYCKNIKYLF